MPNNETATRQATDLCAKVLAAIEPATVMPAASGAAAAEPTR